MSQIEQIATLVDKGDYRKAEIMISKLFRSGESKKDLGTALRLRAKIRLKTDRIDEVIEDLKELRTSFPDAFDYSTKEMLASAYLERFEQAQVGFSDRNDLIQATALFEEITVSNQQYADLGWVYYQLGRIALIDNDINKSKELLIRALLSASNKVTLTAYCYERLGFLEYYETRDMWQALVFLDKAIHTYPTDASLIWLVQVYLLRSRVLREFDSTEALESAKSAINLAQESSEYREVVAETAFAVSEILASMQGQEQILIEQLQLFFSNSKRPVGIDVSWSRAYEMMGDAYTQLGQHDRAISAYEASLQHNPYHPWEESIYYRIAQNHYHQGNYERTVEIIERIENTKSTDSTFGFNLNNLLGNAYFALKNYPDAQKAYMLAMSNASSVVDTHQTMTYLQLAKERNQPL